MQIIPFPAHYQSIYINFDISSFSLISCTAIGHLWDDESLPFARRKLSFNLSASYVMGKIRGLVRLFRAGNGGDDAALVGLFYLDNIAFCLLTRIVKFLLHGGIHVSQLADGQFLGIVVGQFQVSL